jgi:hypothetical protein
VCCLVMVSLTDLLKVMESLPQHVIDAGEAAAEVASKKASDSRGKATAEAAAAKATAAKVAAEAATGVAAAEAAVGAAAAEAAAIEAAGEGEASEGSCASDDG